jgi:hypothetical protein
MSATNGQTLQLWYEAFNRGDFGAAVEQVVSDVELAPGVVAPDQDARYVGPSGVKEFLSSVAEVWDSVAAEPLEQIAVDSERILSIDRWRFSASQGMEIDRELPTIYAFRGGLIARIDGFTDRDEALEAVGLSE